jgi:hypothetical protein
MIVDYQGRVPRYVIDGDKFIHQYTGCYVQLHEPHTPDYIIAAMARLKNLLYASGYSADEINNSIYVDSYPIK